MVYRHNRLPTPVSKGRLFRLASSLIAVGLGYLIGWSRSHEVVGLREVNRAFNCDVSCLVNGGSVPVQGEDAQRVNFTFIGLFGAGGHGRVSANLAVPFAERGRHRPWCLVLGGRVGSALDGPLLFSCRGGGHQAT